MVERYPDDLELAFSADDVERIVKSGKIASLIGIEGGVAIENDLAQLRAFYRLGAALHDADPQRQRSTGPTPPSDAPSNHGLSPFGERVVREMNRLGMLVDISHVSAETMADALARLEGPGDRQPFERLRHRPQPAERPRRHPARAASERRRRDGQLLLRLHRARGRREDQRRGPHGPAGEVPRPGRVRQGVRGLVQDATRCRAGRSRDVADHIDHIVKVAGIDHVGIGSDFDGITAWPVGLEDVSCFPRLTEELLRRGYSEADVHKILGGNVLRAFREAGPVAEQLQKTTRAGGRSSLARRVLTRGL